MNRKIQIITPAPAGSLTGNRITAERWGGFLSELGHEIGIHERYDGSACDLLIALHARRSAESIASYRRDRASGPLVVALTGTDLYEHIHVDEIARRSLDLATHLVVLQDRGVDSLPESVRGKAHVIYQSVAPGRSVREPVADTFQVCVLGHLRPVKDPLRTALATRELPVHSRIRVLHAGGSLDDMSARAARAEMAGNPRYVWLGELPHEQALELLARSHVHVLTSRMEGGANAICEAIVLGTPTVATRIPGTIGLLGEDHEGFFEFGNTAQLAALLERTESDEAFYNRLLRQCKRRAFLFEPQRERDALEQLVVDACS